jgi:hypothetical protein
MPCGRGRLLVARYQLRYEGAFVGGEPEIAPTKLNAYYLAPDSAPCGSAAPPPRRGSAAGGTAAGRAAALASQAGGLRGTSSGSGGAASKSGAKEDATALEGDAALAPQQQAWRQLEPAPPLQVVAGQALGVELVIAAQREVPLSAASDASRRTTFSAGAAAGGLCDTVPWTQQLAPEPEAPRQPAASAQQTPAASSSGGRRGGGGAHKAAQWRMGTAAGASDGATASPARSAAGCAAASSSAGSSPAVAQAEPVVCMRPMYFELPASTNGGPASWRTAETEFGRRVMVTLQRQPPQPLAPGRSLSAMLCCVQQAMGDEEGAGGSERPASAVAAAQASIRVELHICLVRSRRGNNSDQALPCDCPSRVSHTTISHGVKTPAP